MTLRPVCLGEAWGGPAEWQGHRSRTLISHLQTCSSYSGLYLPSIAPLLRPKPWNHPDFLSYPHPIQWQTCWLHSLPPPLLAALPFLEHKHNPTLRPLQLLFPLPETLHYKGGRQILLIPFRFLLKRHLLREVFSKPLHWLPLL